MLQFIATKLPSPASLISPASSAAYHAMAQSKASASRAQPRRSTRNVKTEEDAKAIIKQEEGNQSQSSEVSQSPPSKAIKREPEVPNISRKRKRIKTEDDSFGKATPTKPTAKTPTKPSAKTKASPTTASPADGKEIALRAKKLKTYSNKSPFPTFPHPTPDECHLANRILSTLHGARKRPDTVVAPKDSAGCGNSPSVLDALVRTILSQNTSDKNSTRAKRSMDEEYGGSDKWDAIVAGGKERLQKTIQSGGLSVVKSKVIISILEQAKEQYGEYSLDHLFKASNEDAMQELLSLKGVGPKTASCVLLFCLRRESFAVDTHVHRITGTMGWRPAGANRDETHTHLDARIPDELKYPLHVLIISHGKKCDECKAGGKSAGKCELRKAFRKGKANGEVKDEDRDLKEEDEVKDEDEDIKEEVKEDEEESDAEVKDEEVSDVSESE